MPKYTKQKVDMEKYLPDDVLSNIFIRLLAKQLVQMRCVCKSWNSLLSESNFVKSHLHHSIHSKDEILLFFKTGGRFTFDSNPDPSAARPSRSPDLELNNFSKFKLPADPQPEKDYSCVIGSVNGLICYSYLSNQRGLVIRIWNPSLSAVLTLPPSSLFHNPTTHLAFGYDPKTDDYKVVRLVTFLREPNNKVSKPQGEVYSMRNGSWELVSHSIRSHIKNFIYRHKVCLDGHIHWLCATYMKRKPLTIVTFDLGAMTFGEIPLPDPVKYSLLRGRVLGVLGGKLCVMTTRKECKCDVWVMNDDESWVKQYVFSQFKCHINPYGFTSRRNEFLFQADPDCCFALYDPIAAKIKNFKIKWTRPLETYQIVEYVDSLVWIGPVGQYKLAT